MGSKRVMPAIIPTLEEIEYMSRIELLTVQDNLQNQTWEPDTQREVDEVLNEIEALITRQDNATCLCWDCAEEIIAEITMMPGTYEWLRTSPDHGVVQKFLHDSAVDPDYARQCCRCGIYLD